MLPLEFENRMKQLLGDEYRAFRNSLDEENVRGVRINTLKGGVEKIKAQGELPLIPLSYAEDGFILDSDEKIGTSPYHHAGLVYMQDPGAMAPVLAAGIKKGDYVLDMCAAPGGKSGQAAALIGEEGFLLSNEFVPKRAKITVGNFERLGIKNAMVSCVDTKEFGKLFSSFFDVVIADVPCSGEGMFRKYSEAVDEWSEENVRICAERGRDILENASNLVKRGGRIIFSTCTYAIEENEKNVVDFLICHPDYRLIRADEKIERITSPGINVFGEEWDCLCACRRFYPHITPGEGQFLAILERVEASEPKILYRGQEKPLDRREMALVEKFLEKNLVSRGKSRVCKVNNNIVLISHGVPVPPITVFSSGVLLGEIRGENLIPSHQFFSAYGDLFCEKVELSDDPERLKAYLHGEEIEYSGGGRGFCAVSFLGACIGGGKIVDKRIKNHYPKGLRNS